jgi:hypothetical protein
VRSTACIILALLAAACAAQRGRGLPPSAGAVPPPAAELTRILAARRSAVESLRGTAKIDVKLESIEAGKPHQERLRGTQAVLVRAPAAFRFEALSAFGVVYVVASDGNQLATYLPRDGVVYRGPATAATIGAATGVLAGAPDVVALLLGSPPVERLDAQAASVSAADPGRSHRGAAAEPDAATFVLHVLGDDGKAVEIGFGPAPDGALVPVSFERFDPTGEAGLRASFSEFETAGAVAMPRRIELATPGFVVTLRYTELSLNPPIGDDRFTLATPAGAREAPYATAQDGPEP